MPQYIIEADMRYSRTVWADDEAEAYDRFFDDFGLDDHLYDEETLDVRIFRQPTKDEGE